MKGAIIASAVATLMSMAAVRAGAEPLRPLVVGLPPHEIVAILRAAGFAPLVRPARGAGVFFVRALDPDDRLVRVTVEARTGRVLAIWRLDRATPTEAAPPFGRGYRIAAPRLRHDPSEGFEDATGTLPVPPRGVPGPSPEFGRRAAPPLPRPRPAVADATPQPSESAAPAAPPKAADEPAPGSIELPPVTPLE